MKPYSNDKRILLIDYQRYWREFSAQTLKSVGFSVCTLDTYNYVLLQECFHSETPDLVVLGCSQVGREEQQLITQILAHRLHLLVLCAFLPWAIMRSLFLQGVDDIMDKPYEAEYLITLVNEVFASLAPRNSYQAVERERAGVA